MVRSAHRDPLAQHLAAAGIGTLIHYPIPPHRSEAYRDLNLPSGSQAIAEELAADVLSLPTGQHLAASDADRCAEAVATFPREEAIERERA